MSDFLDGQEKIDETFKINAKFAQKYETRKRKEELHKLKHMSEGEDEDESDSETEDEDGEQLTKELDKDIMKTLKMIKSKDPTIYNPSVAFFKDKEPEETAPKEKSVDKPVYYKDLVRQNALNGDDSSSEEEEEEAVKTYAEEQQELKSEFLSSVAQPEEEDESFFQVREKSQQEQETETAEFEKFKSENKKDDMDDNEFLQHYLTHRGWIDKKVQPTYDDIVNDDEDADALEEADEFEKKYNFRFEEDGGTVIQTYTRNVEGSLRRVDDARKRKREERKERKALERQKKEEELRRLKNLKQQEIQDKINKIAQVAGKEANIDLEADFDPEEHDRQMAELFNDEYYDEVDDKKPKWDDDEEDEDQQVEEVVEEEEEEAAEEIEDEPMPPVENLEAERQKYLDELYKLDYEDLIGDLQCRFKYRSVEKNNYGLDTETILLAEDTDLKKLVSLKRMAPYVDREYHVNSRTAKQFKYQLRKAKEEEKASKKRKPQPEAEPEASVQESVQEETKKPRRKRKKKTKKDDKLKLSESRLESYRLKPLN